MVAFTIGNAVISDDRRRCKLRPPVLQQRVDYASANCGLPSASVLPWRL